MTEQIHITIGTPHMRDFTPEYLVSLTLTLLDGRYRYSCNFGQGSVIHYNRNAIAKRCNTEYLLFIDSDMFWIPENIETLVKADKDIATGLYFTRTPPLTAEVNLKSHEADIKEIISQREPVELLSSGCGFMLIKKTVLTAFFSRGIWPFDLVPVSAVQAEQNVDLPSDLYWEDYSFCFNARKLGFKVWLIPNASVGHVGERHVIEDNPWESWRTAADTIWT